MTPPGSRSVIPPRKGRPRNRPDTARMLRTPERRETTPHHTPPGASAWASLAPSQAPCQQQQPDPIPQQQPQPDRIRQNCKPCGTHAPPSSLGVSTARARRSSRNLAPMNPTQISNTGTPQYSMVQSISRGSSTRAGWMSSGISFTE